MARTRPWELSDEVWERAEPLLPAAKPRPKGDRPPRRDREIGASTTVYDRFRAWERDGFFTRQVFTAADRILRAGREAEVGAESSALRGLTSGPASTQESARPDGGTDASLPATGPTAGCGCGSGAVRTGVLLLLGGSPLAAAQLTMGNPISSSASNSGDAVVRPPLPSRGPVQMEPMRYAVLRVEEPDEPE